jgi:hypothetical protein
MVNKRGVDSVVTKGVQANEKNAKQVEAIISEILRDHPQLQIVRASKQKDTEPSDKFAREFLHVFRKRLQT